MNIIVGKFDTVCELFAPTKNTNGASGEVTLTYPSTPTRIIWCYQNNRSNNEVFNDMQRQENTTITIDCFYGDITELGVTARWIMKINGNTFNINSINDAIEYSRNTVIRLSGIERK